MVWEYGDGVVVLISGIVMFYKRFILSNGSMGDMAASVGFAGLAVRRHGQQAVVVNRFHSSRLKKFIF